MSIPVKKGGAAPGVAMKTGLHMAVVTGVRDLGEQPDRFNEGKMRRSVVVTFTNAAGEEASRFYTPSWHEKANYRKDMESAFDGKVPEAIQNDIEQVLGVQVQIVVKQEKNIKGYLNAKVQSVLPPADGQKVVPVVKAGTPPSADNDDDIPF